MKDGLTCSGRDGELSAGGRRAVSGRRLVLHGALQLAGGVIVLGASIVGGIGVARSRHDPRESHVASSQKWVRSFVHATRSRMPPGFGFIPGFVPNWSRSKLENALLVDKYKNHAPTPIFKRVSPK